MARYAWAVGLSTVLHVGLLYQAWPETPNRLTPSIVYISSTLETDRPETPVPPVLPHAVKSQAAVSQPLAEQAHAAATATDLSSARSDPLASPSETLPDAPMPTVSQPAENSVNTESIPQAAPSPPDGYFPFEDVDQPATPIGEWLINADMLPRGAVLRIELWLWIAASGKIDRWELAPGTESEALVLRVLNELSETAVQPALRNNLAVPSFRRLEVVLSRE